MGTQGAPAVELRLKPGVGVLKKTAVSCSSYNSDAKGW
jgi:hypothetical protein